MSAWACETSNSSLNNSGAQGEEYYLNFTAQSQAGEFMSVNGVNGCDSTEDVEDGTVYIGTQGPYSGLVAIENDMLGTPPANSSASCGALGAVRLSLQ
jgi:nicotinamide mononucleotide (NMN) deamidase PncC